MNCKHLGSFLRAAAASVLLVGSVGRAATYTDSTGDGGNVVTWPHLDISTVDVSNTATDISFTINLVGSPIVTNWGEYQLGIDSIPGGATSGIVPNGRPISISSGMDYYIRSWHTGAETYHWDASGPYWARDNATWAPPSAIQIPTKTFFSVKLTTTLASLGLSAGDSFKFDVWSAGGTPTDSAVDALANPAATAAGNDWVTPYDAGANVFQYTVTGVPEPSSVALALFGAMGLWGLRRK